MLTELFSAVGVSCVVVLVYIHMRLRRRWKCECLRRKRLLEAKSNQEVLGRMSLIIAHDMRSPLSALKSYIESQGPFQGGDAEMWRVLAERSVHKLMRMVDDFADYARASRTERVEHDVHRIIRESVIAETKIAVDAPDISVQCDCPGELIAYVDGYQLERTLTNLLRNAIHAVHDRSGRIDVSSAVGPSNELVIRISDNGDGIRPEYVPHIFDAFFTKGKQRGAGLGLAYCKQVIEAHGGTIDVESEFGKGATFTIRIPDCVVGQTV